MKKSESYPRMFGYTFAFKPDTVLQDTAGFYHKVVGCLVDADGRAYRLRELGPEGAYYYFEAGYVEHHFTRICEGELEKLYQPIFHGIKEEPAP